MEDHEAATEHRAIAEALPDYALGAMEASELRRVARHLETCASCREELAQALDVLGALADVGPPSAAARTSLLARAAGLAGGAPEADRATRSDATPPAPGRTRPADRVATGRRLLPSWRPRDGRGWLVAAAVLALLVVPLAGWNVALRSQLEERDLIYALVTDPAAAHPLDDSELPTDAAGVIFAAPSGHEAYLVASGLPALPPDRRYQIWLFTEDGERISAGLFAVEPDGEGRMLLRTPEPFGEYVAAGVSAEPREGSPAPTSSLALGGWIGG